MAAGPDRFAARVAELGLPPFDVRHSDETTHTAAEAAEAVGTVVGAIVKSLLLVVGDGDDAQHVLALVSGANRVDPLAVAADLGAGVRMADAKTVKRVTGFSIGGVPPLGHPQPLPTVIDADLLAFDEVWAAAGGANDVFPIAPARLVELTGARTVHVH
jgi:prolyl-tRNA editing enzyme YbaK/EbsC (Cys-tRNA(Pro) deacylase)